LKSTLEGLIEEEMGSIEQEVYANSDRHFDVLFSVDRRAWSKLELPPN
jgi:hypothetical protein